MAKIKYSEKYQNYLNSLSKETLLKILENSYTEVFVTNNKDEYVYTNPVCMRHYGLTPEQIMDKNIDDDLRHKRWEISLSDQVKKTKKVIIAKNKYYAMEQTVVTICVPVLDENGQVELLVSTTQDPIYFYDFNINDNQEVAFSKDQQYNIIGSSQSLIDCLNLLKKVSQTDINLLILGESGTGKSYLSKYVHNNSKRKDQPFIAINCSAIPESLFESELFGYSPHAFTGASNKGKQGILKVANGGTLFLDEIGELSLNMQVKILEVIENKQFTPVGSTISEKIDVRIITATNKDLHQMVEEKKFREDLYWRLNSVKTTLPPLRQRPEDIISLANYFLNNFNEKYGYNKYFSKKTAYYLCDYQWPGNIRQLQNAIERLVILSEDQIITEKDFLQFVAEEETISKDNVARTYQSIIEETERNMIRESYLRHKSSRKVAIDLEISQSTAYRLIRKYIYHDDVEKL